MGEHYFSLSGVYLCTTMCVICYLCILPDEETEGLFLVDFTQKIIDNKRQTFARQETERDDEDRRSLSPIPAPQNPDEEW